MCGGRATEYKPFEIKIAKQKPNEIWNDEEVNFLWRFERISNTNEGWINTIPFVINTISKHPVAKVKHVYYMFAIY